MKSSDQGNAYRDQRRRFHARLENDESRDVFLALVARHADDGGFANRRAFDIVDIL